MPVFITQKLIESGASRFGGWSHAQLRLLGVEVPPRKGWRRRIDGQPIAPADARRFLALRDAHLSAANRSGDLFSGLAP